MTDSIWFLFAVFDEKLRLRKLAYSGNGVLSVS